MPRSSKDRLIAMLIRLRTGTRRLVSERKTRSSKSSELSPKPLRRSPRFRILEGVRVVEADLDEDLGHLARIVVVGDADREHETDARLADRPVDHLLM